MEPGKVKLDTRGRRTAMAEDIREMLEQSRMILELNKKILDIVHSSSNWTIQMGKLQDFDLDVEQTEKLDRLKSDVMSKL